MFCIQCGRKNEKDSRFCEECGTSITGAKQNKAHTHRGMTTVIAYDKDVIREKTADGPFLVEGEEIRYQSVFAVPPSTYLLALIMLFVPPLFILWSAIIFGLSLRMTKRKTLWLTNRRLVYSIPPTLGGSFTVVSIPISEIRVIRRRFLVGFVFGLIDRIFGVSTIQVHVKGKLLSQLLIPNIRDASTLLKTIKSISSELVEGE